MEESRTSSIGRVLHSAWPKIVVAARQLKAKHLEGEDLVKCYRQLFDFIAKQYTLLELSKHLEHIPEAAFLAASEVGFALPREFDLMGPIVLISRPSRWNLDNAGEGESRIETFHSNQEIERIGRFRIPKGKAREFFISGKVMAFRGGRSIWRLASCLGP